MATRAAPWRYERRHKPPVALRRGGRMTQPLLTVATLLTVIPSLPRLELGRLVQRMIDRMDDIDGDPDSEVYGDELDGSLGEDDFHSHNAGICPGAGCPVSDPGGGMVEDEGQMGTVPYPKTGCTQGAALRYGSGATRTLEAFS